MKSKICLLLMVLIVSILPGGVARSSEGQVVVETETTFDSTAIVKVLNVPARAVLCGANIWLGSILMTFSGGARYGDAADIMEEGCSGPWAITREMIDRARPPKKEARRAVWELDRLR